MALKPDRDELFYDLSYFVTSITGPDTTRMTRGGGLVAETGTPGSGAAMDSANQVALYLNASPSGRKAVGILLNDVVNIDFSRQQLNPYKDEVQVGSKVTVGRKGIWVTNNIMPGQATGTMPATAYIGTSGNFTDVNPGGYPQVGEFLSRRDPDGYAKIRIDL